jgi:radical SAM superfamily enzyme YgiQ (UPF0313 family)
VRILLVYPEFPDTFWSFRHALKFISKKAVYPPLGALTVAAMLPDSWEKKLIDMNVESLDDSSLKWADFVFISAMSVQSESVAAVIRRCREASVKIVAGGPLFTAWYDRYDNIDHLVLNEAEATLPLFLADLEKGSPKHIYMSEERPDISMTPIPLWELIDMKKYSAMNIQYSRGCPFNCEFCDVVVLFGHTPRLKTSAQVRAELQSLYDLGWRDSVFFVDDNFIGNRQKIKEEVLPAIIDWLQQHGNPFSFHTEASINLSDDIELMQLMVKAGFNMVFIGIESPNEESLEECNKKQNKGRNLLESVAKMQRQGLEVDGGFILGFDSDPDSIFDTMIQFIQQSGIVVAMVGLLNAPRGTRLFKRLKEEQRILSGFTGDNTDFTMNFRPKMGYEKLANGYRRVISTIYSPRFYYQRIMQYLKRDGRIRRPIRCRMHLTTLLAFFRSIFKLGVAGKERVWFWRLVFYTLFHHPSQLHKAITYAVYGYHFRTIYRI